jgi:succinate-semialdehyde dehydrogenase/glutarate-semialdehyde dehydrogenase
MGRSLPSSATPSRPASPVCSFDTEEEVLSQANSTRYGLAAYAYTNDLNRAWRLAEGLEAGTIAINDAVPSTSNAPFGGMKESGLGRELGSEGLEAFLETKHISFGVVKQIRIESFISPRPGISP